MTKLLLGSKNKGKIREFKALLAGLGFELITPLDIALDVEVIEAGSTYTENAALKASALAQASRLVTLADDSGLEVDILNRAPGLYSARYAPQPEASDADRRKYLLQNLQDYPRPWLASFRCSVVIAEPGGKTFVGEGTCRGEIIPEERGQHGFGYDPIFYIPQAGRTMAELKMEEKNRLSHRAEATRNAIPILLQYLGSNG